jgi:hypothetical protein
MPKLKVNIRTSYGEVEISGETPEEVIEGLGWLTKDYVSEINEMVSNLASAQSEDILKDIVRVSRDGPTIITTYNLNHYESIGLVLYAMKNHQASSRELRERLASSGKKVTVATRLHEMRNRGHIFKPDIKSNEYKLTSKGVKWLEDEVLPRLKVSD